MDGADENVYPGEPYDAERLTPQAYKFALYKPIFEEQLAADQWGRFLSGYAPIRDEKGNTVAVLGLDMEIEHLYRLTRSKFSSFSESSM